MAAMLKKRALAEFQASSGSGSSTLVVAPPDTGPSAPKVLKLRPPRSPAQFPASPSVDRALNLAGKLAVGVRRPLELLKSCTGKTPCTEVMRAVQVLVEELAVIQPSEVPVLLDLLLDAFEAQQESTVRVAILSLLPKLCLSDRCACFVPLVCEKIVETFKKVSSEKVKARAIMNLRQLCEDSRCSLPRSARRVLFNLAKDAVVRSSHLVRCQSLELLSILFVEDGERGSLKIVLDHITDQDARVRTVAYRAFLKLKERKAAVHPAMYEALKTGLNDDYESVREMALLAIVALSELFPDHPFVLPNSDSETIRLVDEVFGRVCSGMSDLSAKVRTLSAELLGRMTNVSEGFVDQTLDKKLMSNMRKKLSAHERQRELNAVSKPGGGRKWGAEDTPKELLDGQSFTLMDLGACGAFVHGLEDQCMAVRTKSIQSIAALAAKNRSAFARQAIDFLVDMFNDEIESVRLQAVSSLTKIGHQVVIREDQLDTILAALEDFSLDIREALHEMLSQCQLSSKSCLKMCVESLLDNLRRYPQDRRSLRRCFKNLGSNHSSLVMLLAPELLLTHPFLDTPENNLNDSVYVCTLIMIFNAAKECPTIFSILENHVINHYRFLRGSLPHLIPEVQLELESSLKTLPSRPAVASASSDRSKAASEAFIDRVMAPGGLLSQRPGDARLLETAVKDLKKVGEMDAGARPRASLAATYAECCLNLVRAVTDSRRLVTSTAPCLFATRAEAALKLSWKLVVAFSGLVPSDGYAVRLVRLKALGLQLMSVWRSKGQHHGEGSSKGSGQDPLNEALLGHASGEFLAWFRQLESFAEANEVSPDPFVVDLTRELVDIDPDESPADVARAVASILPRNLSPTLHLSPATKVRMAKGTIYEPKGTTESDNPLKFTANLILGLPLDCEVKDVADANCIRIKVKYPDQTSHLIAPRKSDIRFDASSTEYRILTTVPISHSAWTEACHVKISICLDLSKSAASETGGAGQQMVVSHGTKSVEFMSPVQAAIQREQQRQREALIVEISEEVPVYVAPKAVRRALT